MPLGKVSTEDLGLAAEWLESYEPAPDEDGSWAKRVAAWLDAIYTRREDQKANRRIARFLNGKEVQP